MEYWNVESIETYYSIIPSLHHSIFLSRFLHITHERFSLVHRDVRIGY